MNDSVSLVLPVCNAQHWLGRYLDWLLDELGSLTDRFEVIIVDDGSLDETLAIAHTLQATFPQIRVIAQPLQYGSQAAQRRGIHEATGDFVVVVEDWAAVRGNDLHRLWQARHRLCKVLTSNQLAPGMGLHRFDSPSTPSPPARPLGATRRPAMRMIHGCGGTFATCPSTYQALCQADPAGDGVFHKTAEPQPLPLGST